MREAIYELVTSEEYRRFEFENDVFAPRLQSSTVWDLMERTTTACGPILLLLRLADSNAATLSKVKGTVDYIKTLMKDGGEDTLEDQICVAFHNRAPELECDIANAAYVLDPQFIKQSRHADADVMASFWKIARSVLRMADDDTAWRRARQSIVSGLAKFRMQTAGFAFEDYDMANTCAFWGAAGCHSPALQRLAFALTSLPCSSGEAERNWQEVKQNLTKKRNRLSKEKLEKMVFVRRFTRLKRAIFVKSKDESGFSEWVQELLVKASADNTTGSKSSDEETDFMNFIESGEQGRINGKEPGKPIVRLTKLKKDNACKS